MFSQKLRFALKTREIAKLRHMGNAITPPPPPPAILVVIAHSMANQIRIFSQYYTSYIISFIITNQHISFDGIRPFPFLRACVYIHIHLTVN